MLGEDFLIDLTEKTFFNLHFLKSRAMLNSKHIFFYSDAEEGNSVFQISFSTVLVLSADRTLFLQKIHAFGFYGKSRSFHEGKAPGNLQREVS